MTLTNLAPILVISAVEHEHQIKTPLSVHLNILLGNRLHAGPITSSLHRWWQVSAEES